MASITSWTRLEPDSRDSEFEAGLQARFYDPLWALARQWQVGEFEGEDNGSPVTVRIRAEVTPIDRVRLGSAGGSGGAVAHAYDPATEPLEVIVEREAVLRAGDGVAGPGGPNLHHRFESGLHFLRLLEHAGVDRYRDDYVNRYALALAPGEEPEDAAGYVDLYRSRVPDGVDLYSDLRRFFPADGSAVGSLPNLPRIATADRQAVIDVIRRWLAWYDELFSEPGGGGRGAWVDERLEYSFAVGGTSGHGQVALEVDEYVGGHLDWYSFDDAPGAAVGDMSDSVVSVVRTVLPAPVAYRAMPAARWWEFEDAVVNLGRVDAAADDLLRMLMIDFALRFSNDWFVVSFEQPIGSLCSITSLVVTDCFGEDTLIDSYGEADRAANDGTSDWRMFTVAAGPDRDRQVGLFLAPALPPSLHSEPIEQVRFLRDELANMAWAVEHTVQDASGRPVRREEQPAAVEAGVSVEAVGEQTDDHATPALRYRLAVGPPDHWTPLLPVRESDSDPSIRLRRGRVARGDGNELRIPAPQGRIIRAGEPLDLFEEEVPASGATVIRQVQRVRWTDGSTHTWVGRRKTNGAGPGSSGLQFDQLTHDVP